MPVTSAVRLPLRLAACLGVALGALVLPDLPRAVAADWPQQHSDVTPDKAMLYGTLPNGMRYAIRHNAMPRGAVSMWLNIDAGSLQESDAQRGLAHFLEHMAFRGSTHVAEAEVWPGLQRLGSAIGADSNAATSRTYTVYQFNFPRSDAETIDAGLLRLRDIASELTLAPTAMDAERGVVLSEERLSDTPIARALKQLQPLLFPGDIIGSRMPIGQTDVIAHAPVALMRDYYNAFYRPERATLIIVGEIDPAAIEAKIKAQFADWKPNGPAGHDPVRPAPGPRAPQASLFVEPGTPSLVQLNWVVPSQPDSIARETNDWVKQVAMKIMKNRLDRLANGPDHPFLTTEADLSSRAPGAVVWTVETSIPPQEWHGALGAAVRVARQMETYGVTAGELDRAERGLRADLENNVATADTRSTRALAAWIQSQVVQNEVDESPSQMLAMANLTFKTLTPDKIKAAIGSLLRDRGPLVFVSSPVPVEGGEAAVTAALDDAMKAPLAPPAAEANATWSQMDFGPAGQIVERKTIADLQTTFVRYANGVRLTVRPSTLRAGEVVAFVRIGNGRQDLPADRPTAIWAFQANALLLGGTKALSFDELQTALSDRILGMPNLMDEGFLIGGGARPQDLGTQLQVLAALVSSPGWRDGGFERARNLAMRAVQDVDTSPSGLFRQVASCELFGKDPRWCHPSLDAIRATKPEEFKALLAPILASAPIEVTIAGDVKLDDAIDAVARTFGALPARGAATSSLADARPVNFQAPTPTPIEVHHRGRADQGVAAIAWHTTDVFHAKDRAALQLLSSILSTRLMDRLRIEEGVTYSPNVDSFASDTEPGQGYLHAEAELPPARMPLFYDAVRAITADLRAHPVTPDELERARKPALAAMISARQTNTFWASSLIGSQDDVRRLGLIRDVVPILKAVTPADVQAAADRYLGDDKAWKLEVTPTPRKLAQAK